MEKKKTQGGYTGLIVIIVLIAINIYSSFSKLEKENEDLRDKLSYIEDAANRLCTLVNEADGFVSYAELAINSNEDPECYIDGISDCLFEINKIAKKEILPRTDR